MDVTVSMDSILNFINSMSLSANNKEWLGRHLIEEAKGEKERMNDKVAVNTMTEEERIMKLSPRLQRLLGCVRITQEEIDNDERLAYILNK